MKNSSKILILFLIVCQTHLNAQKTNVKNDVTAPLHALQPDYPVAYVIPTRESILKDINKVFNYLDAVTPTVFVNRLNQKELKSPNEYDTNTILKPGDFRLTSYEWGVTYSGLLALTEASGDSKYGNYVKSRLEWISKSLPAFRTLLDKYPKANNPFKGTLEPRALDDAGALCAATIKLLRVGGANELRQMIDNLINYVYTGQQRFADGTLARNRPQKNTLWLDDLYMSVPALAQMAKLTGDAKYYDDAVKQVLQFSQRMFNKEQGLYMHGWVEGMNTHPEFRWARANGWAMLAMTELLLVLPDNHPGRASVISQLQEHIKGIASRQDGTGFWHQLLDRNDSYLETSATAIYTYCIAKAVNKGWIDKLAYSPMVLLGWNAVRSKINSKGQVEGTCVGTGMAFDPAFYYFRPVNVYAAHGYGPVLLAGAELIELLKNYSFEMNDSSIQLKEK
jgi:unsaturated rhamnogalacturonyl hydrolase